MTFKKWTQILNIAGMRYNKVFISVLKLIFRDVHVTEEIIIIRKAFLLLRALSVH